MSDYEKVTFCSEFIECKKCVKVLKDVFCKYAPNRPRVVHTFTGEIFTSFLPNEDQFWPILAGWWEENYWVPNDTFASLLTEVKDKLCHRVKFTIIKQNKTFFIKIKDKMIYQLRYEEGFLD